MCYQLTSAARFVPLSSHFASTLFSLSKFSTATSLFSFVLILFIFVGIFSYFLQVNTTNAENTTDRHRGSFVQKLIWRRLARANPFLPEIPAFISQKILSTSISKKAFSLILSHKY